LPLDVDISDLKDWWLRQYIWSSFRSNLSSRFDRHLDQKVKRKVIPLNSTDKVGWSNHLVILSLENSEIIGVISAFATKLEIP